MYLIKNLLSNPNFNKLSAVVFGYLIWSALSIHTITMRTLVVPLCFYGPHDKIITQAPEEVTVVLQGQRNTLWKLNTEDLAIHVNSELFTCGTQTFNITDQNLLLPNTLHLQETIPTTITVMAKQLTDE